MPGRSPPPACGKLAQPESCGGNKKERSWYSKLSAFDSIGLKVAVSFDSF
jgi:hypothetical protein